MIPNLSLFPTYLGALAIKPPTDKHYSTKPNYNEKTPWQPLNNYAQPKICVPFSKQGIFHHFPWFTADIFFSILHPLSRESAKGYSSYLIEYRHISLISLELDFHYLGLYYFNSTIISLLSPALNHFTVWKLDRTNIYSHLHFFFEMHLSSAWDNQFLLCR